MSTYERRRGSLIPRSVLATELGVHPRTLKRWLDKAKLGFPAPILINGRNYFVREAIEKWKDEQLKTAMAAA